MLSRFSSLTKPTTTRRITQQFYNFHTTIAKMGVTKQMISPGDGQTKAKAGDTITMEYTGNLEDKSAANGKGKQYVAGASHDVSFEC
jgi:FK506-binding protein 1